MQPPTQLPALPAAAEAAESLAAIEAEVEVLHRLAQEHNKAGRVAEATKAYKQMAALDDRALLLALSSPAAPGAAERAQHAAAHPVYCTPHRPEAWPSPGARGRAFGCVLGAAVADAAAMGVHWVYDLSLLEAWHAERAAAGEQTLALLRSLVAAGGLDCLHYAGALWEAFGPGFDGYRDVSTKAFLRRYATGLLPPATGAPSDRQANAFTRLPPLVALYAGDARLGAVVEAMIRVTQNDDVAVAFGLAAAAILEQLILSGPSVAAAVQLVAAGLQQRAAEQAAGVGEGSEAGPAAPPLQTGGSASRSSRSNEPGQQYGSAGIAARLSPALAAEVAGALLRAAELAPLTPPEATQLLGRNCHLPTSLQTALHILLHVEIAGGRHMQQAAGPEKTLNGPGGSAESGQRSGPGGTSSSSPAPQQAQQGAGTRAGGEDAAAFCLPCSLGAPGDGSATQCAWRPGSRQPGAAAATAAQTPAAATAAQTPAAGVAPTSPAAAADAAAATAAAALSARRSPEEVYTAAVRAALREGGCCASRAAFVGACLGALGGEAAVPRAWREQLTGWEDVRQLAGELCELRA